MASQMMIDAARVYVPCTISDLQVGMVVDAAIRAQVALDGDCNGLSPITALAYRMEGGYRDEERASDLLAFFEVF